MKAGDLKPGMRLTTPEGTTAVLDETRTFGKRQRTHDLTIAELHAYYVLAEAAPVLVHNCGGAVDGHSPICECNPEKPRSEVTLDRDSFEQARNTGLDLIGTLDDGSTAPLVGRLEAAIETYGKLTGFTGRSGGDYREFRLDVDGVKGAHINVMTGKGASVRKWAIRWPGASVTPWLRRNA
ncbi:hypothetical protein ACWEFL_32050 [Streptomyces sp. NPDC004838]